MNGETAVHRIRLAKQTKAANLDLSDLKLDSVPAELVDCQSLRALNVSGNDLQEIPEAVCSLSKLQRLDASRNKIGSVPQSVESLTELTGLRLDQNAFNNFPESILELKLETLRLDHNQIEQLPEAIEKLDGLISLNLANNRLSALPGSIGRLKLLEMLDLSDNKLKELPAEALGELPKLRGLLLHGNEDLELSDTTLGRRGVSEGVNRTRLILKEYVNVKRRLKDPGQPRPRSLAELKVVVLGQSAANRSGVVASLLGITPNVAAAPGRFRVRRVAIPSWQSRANRNDSATQLNFWGFRKRDVLHIAHTLFVGSRNLALIVLSPGEQAERSLDYWIKLIQCHEGKESVPVIAVVVESDQEKVEIHERRARFDHPANLVGIHRVSFVTDQGTTELRRAIEREAGQLSFVSQEQPASFFDLRSQLETLFGKHRVIRKDELTGICDGLAIDRSQRQEYVDLLADIGMLQELDDGDLVDAEWLAMGLDAVFNRGTSRDSHELIDSTEIDAILQQAGQSRPGDAVMLHQLLFKLDLCYALPGSNGRILIIPELLSENEPDFPWDFKEALNLELKYEILPPDVLPTFIVTMRENIPRPDARYWRQGVILEFDDHSVLVRADLLRARIKLSVLGPESERPKILARVWDALEQVNLRFPALKRKVELPLPDDPLVTVDYEHVLRLESRKEEFYWPPEKDKKYRIADLLKGRRRRSRNVRPAEEGIDGPRTVRIAKVHLRNLRNLEDVELDLRNESGTRDWLLILGENGLGKSTILRAIAAGLCEKSTAIRLLAEIKGGVTRLGSSKPAVIEMTLVDPNGPTEYVRTTEVSGTGEKLSVEQRCPQGDRPDLTFVCGYGADRKGEGSSLEQGFDIYSSVGSLFRSNLELQNPETVLRRVKDSGDRLDSFIEQMEKVLDLQAGSIKLEAHGVVAAMSSGGPAYPLQALGSGYQATLLWLCDFLGWAVLFDKRFCSAILSGIVLIDELEQHLHPRWQRVIIRRLADQFPGVQFIATSHSAICAGGMADLDEDRCRLICLDRRDGDESVLCRKVGIPAGLRYDQIMVEEFGIRMAIDVTTEEILDEIRREYEELGPGRQSQKLNDAMEKLRRRSRSVYEGVLSEQVQSEVASSLKDIMSRLGLDRSRTEPSA